MRKDITRRTFVEMAGIAAGAMALGGNSLALASEKETFKAGTYTTTTTGMEGDFDVTATCTDSKIDKIEVGDNSETLMVGTAALDILSKRIVDTQSLGVDSVAGATVSSMAIIRAVDDLVDQAGGDVDTLEKVPVTIDTYEGKTTDADVLVIGGGLAGTCAAISAAQAGASVILLEEKEFTAGNSALSTGSFLLGGTSVQEAAGIKDDADSFYQWIMDKSDNKKDPDQAKIIAENSQALVDWFDSIGVEFDPEVGMSEGSDIDRSHYLTPSIGAALQTMDKCMADLGVDVRYATKGQKLVVAKDGTVTGVDATDYYGNDVTYTGKAVILASGGFGDNHDMIVKYWGDGYKNLVYGGLKGMDGTLLEAGIDIGADTVDMDSPHVDATLEVNKAVTITTNLLVKCGGILIRQSTGQRFADEAKDHCEEAATAMHDLGDEYYWEIYDDNANTVSDAISHKFDAYNKMGLTTQYDSVDDMAKGIGVDAKTLQQTLDDYNAAVRGEKADEFGRETFYKELAAPFYVVKVSNGVACTVGGLKVNTDMQVLDTDGKVIPALYAIGEIAGGYLIKYRGGDSLSHSAIGGMLTGSKAAESI